MPRVEPLAHWKMQASSSTQGDARRVPGLAVLQVPLLNRERHQKAKASTMPRVRLADLTRSLTVQVQP